MNPFHASTQMGKPKAKRIAGPLSVGLPPLFRGVTLSGDEPSLTDRTLTLAGTVLSGHWYPTRADRTNAQNGILCFELRVLECEKVSRSALLRALSGPRSSGQKPLTERAEKYHCKAELIEWLAEDHPYGRYVRLQGTIVPETLDARMHEGRIVTPFEFNALVATPSGSEVRSVKTEHGLDLLQGLRQIVAPNLLNGERLTDPQVDRIFECFFILSWITRNRAHPSKLGSGGRMLLTTELGRIEEREEALIPRLSAAFTDLLAKRSEYNQLVAANAEEERRLRARIVPQDSSLADAESAFEAKRINLKLDELKAAESEAGRQLKTAKKLHKKNPRHPSITVARTALNEVEERRKEAERQLRPFEERVRAAKKLDRRPEEELDRFLRERKSREDSVARLFNSVCSSNHGLWNDADRAFQRREQILAELRYATDGA